jgi:asparagine synthase (glutamine-hydrolysing)
VSNPLQVLRDEVFVFDPAQPATNFADQPTLLWAAPGSMFLNDVQRAWQQRAELSDLAEVSGPWAVALWCPRQGYVLATDPLGVQPLFWARTSDGHIAAASWLAKLVDRPDVDDALDYEGVLLSSSHRLSSDAVAHRTNFSAVSKIPFGRAALFGPSHIGRVVRYWDPYSLPGPDDSLTLHDSANLLQETVDAAITRLLPDDDAPMGAHVSGGLDCTSIACRANEILRQRGSSLKGAYSWSPDEREVPRFDGDERGLLDDVAARLGIAISPVYADESGDWHITLDPNRYPHSTHNRERFVLPKAKSDGIRVMLSGWGGDEMASFNGRGVIDDLIRRGQWAALWRVIHQRRTVTSGVEPSWATTFKTFTRQLARRAPHPITNLRHPKRSRLMKRHNIDVLRRLEAFSPVVADAYRDHGAAFRSAKNHHDMQLALLVNGHLQHRTTGWYLTGRLFDVEYRYPLLDKIVVETALTLPWPAFFSQGWDRVTYRLAIQPWVPASVAWNSGKYEPAHMWPPHKVEVPRSTPEPTQPEPDDDRYREVMGLAKSLRPPVSNRISATARVQSLAHSAVLLERNTTTPS